MGERGVKKRKRAGRPRGAYRAGQKLTAREHAEIVMQHVAGVPNKDIARAHRVSDATISLLLAKFQPLFSGLENVSEYKAIQSDLLDATGLQVLKSMNLMSKHDNATLGELARAYDVVNKHSRLTKGLSTSNVSEKSESIVRVLPPVSPDR